MPPKKEERKPLQPLFQIIDPFYRYQECDQIDQLNEFLTYFKPELSVMMKNNIFENMEILSKQVGLPLHPSFVKPNTAIDLNDFDENTKFRNPDEFENDQAPQIVQLNTIKVDLYTLRLLEFCAGVSGVHTLKLCNNGLDSQTYNSIAQLLNNPEVKIKKLYIDWQLVTESFLERIQSLDFLSLRSCSLNESQIQTLCNNGLNLKCLDLYDNHLTKDELNIIGKMLGQNANLESLGLARNGITSFNDLQGITQTVGRFLMTQEEYDEYKIKEKERDTVIERNKKVKKKGTEEVVPVLEPIQQIENNWYIIRNQKLILLNLSMNQIDDNSRDQMEKFLTQTGENFQLVLMNNRFEDQKTLQRIKKKFGKKLVI